MCENVGEYDLLARRRVVTRIRILIRYCFCWGGHFWNSEKIALEALGRCFYTGWTHNGHSSGPNTNGRNRPLTAVHWSHSQWPLTDRKSVVRTTLLNADYRVPDSETGDQAIPELRQRAGRELPGVIVTGEVMPAAWADAMNQGLHVMKKPVRPAKLRALLRHLLQG